jgi:uncharacterized membrane protein
LHGQPPDLSRIDAMSLRLLADGFGIDRHNAVYQDAVDQNRRLVRKFNRHPTTTFLHVVPGALFMLLAPLQFSRRFRARHPRWHRIAGRVLVVIAIPIAISGLYFGLAMPFAGFAEASAVALFGALFLISITRAFVAIRRGDVEQHREWMTRMFGIAIGVALQRVMAMICAAVTLRGPESWFALSVWLGFGIGAASAEILIRTQQLSTISAAAPPRISSAGSL